MDSRSIASALISTTERCGSEVALLEHRAGGISKVDYATLGSLVDRLAVNLIGMGAGRGDNVALLGPNSSEWVIAFLAVQRIGATAVLLANDLTVEELRGLMKTVPFRLLLTPEDEGRVSGLPIPTLTWREDANRDLRESFTNWEVKGDLVPPSPEEIRADNTAAIIFTSGTTAKPKGVMLTHRNMLFDLDAFLKLASVSASDRVLLVLPLHHAFSLTVGLLAGLCVGASVVIDHDVRNVAARMTDTSPTVFLGVPGLFDAMLERVRERIDRQRGRGSFQRLTTQLAHVKQLTGINVGPIVFRQLRDRLGGRLRFVASGGAAIRRSTVLGFLRLGIPLLQGYGLTEAGPVCAAQPYSVWRFRFSRHYERLAGSVGRALPGVDLALSASHVTATEQGEGELIVRGPNVMAGYYGDPDATREAVRDGWLHTGDLCRVDNSGWVWVTGRAKDIIVLDTGENVNPEEVESLIARSSLLADSCILAAGGRQRELRLVVHPNLEDAQIGADLTGGQRALQAACEEQAKELLEQLAPYKRPSRILIAPDPLPRTPLGKVKRHEIERLYS